MMTKTLAAVVLMAAVLLVAGGCASDGIPPGAFDDLLTSITSGGDAPDTPPGALPDSGQFDYTVSEVWSGPESAYKVVGSISEDKHGAFWTVCNVYRSGFRSEIYRRDSSGKIDRVYAGGEETVGQPFALADGSIWFPVEHGGKRALRWDGSRIVTGASLPGRWSVAGAEYNGAPVVACNDSFQGDLTFADRPKLVDARTGAVVRELPAKSMPRAFCHYGGALYVTLNFGAEVLVRLTDDRVTPTRALSLASYGGSLYGGGGASWGARNVPDGNLYRIDAAGKETVVCDTGAKAIPSMCVADGALWFATIGPDRLYVLRAAGVRPQLVREFPLETEMRDFGATVCADSAGGVWWGRSDPSKAHVYRVMGKPAATPDPTPTPDPVADFPSNTRANNMQESVAKWAVTCTIGEINWEPSRWTWKYLTGIDRQKGWKPTARDGSKTLNGQVIFLLPDGAGGYWECALDYTLPGEGWHVYNMFESHGNLLDGPMKGWKAKAGDRIGFLVASGNWRACSPPVSRERSNVLWFVYPGR